MSVHWKPLPEGFKVPEADYTGRVYVGGSKGKAGRGKKKCGLCGYRIRGREDDHEKGYHHQHPKKKGI